MTRLIARLVLAMLILPLTGAVFVLALGAFVGRSGPPAPAAIAIIWAVVYTFVATYWVLLWRDLVRWNRARKLNTVLAGPLALLAGVVAGSVLLGISHAPTAAGMFVGGGVVPIVWVLTTVLVWRETPQERMERITAAGTDSICCPVCGYNMTGLRESRCPECGSRFTLDQLLAGQPNRDTKTLPCDQPAPIPPADERIPTGAVRRERE
jgi:hypothetical protein